MTLSPTQAAILTAALQHPLKLVVPPKLPPAPREAIRRGLLGKGVIGPADLAVTNGATAWSVGGTLVNYRITEAGLVAVGVAPVSADMPANGPTTAAEATPGADRSAQCSAEAQPPQDASQAFTEADPPRRTWVDVCVAGQAVLAAWDDEAGPGPAAGSAG